METSSVSTGSASTERLLGLCCFIPHAGLKALTGGVEARRGSAASEKSVKNEPVNVIGNLWVRVHQWMRMNDNEQGESGRVRKNDGRCDWWWSMKSTLKEEQTNSGPNLWRHLLDKRWLASKCWHNHLLVSLRVSLYILWKLWPNMYTDCYTKTNRGDKEQLLAY